MSYLHVYIFVILCASNHVLCKTKIPCDWDNEQCITKGAQSSFKNAVTWSHDGKSSDPLKVDLIDISSPTLEYKLSNAKLTGLGNCVVTKVKMIQTKLSYDYKIMCPKLTVESEYETKGNINDVPVEGKGKLKSEFEDYEITFLGEYEKHTTAEISHIYVINKSYKLVPKGKVTYEYSNLFNGDNSKSKTFHEHFAKENWKALDKPITEPTVNALINEFLKYANHYYQTIPIEHVFAYYA